MMMITGKWHEKVTRAALFNALDDTISERWLLLANAESGDQMKSIIARTRCALCKLFDDCTYCPLFDGSRICCKEFRDFMAALSQTYHTDVLHARTMAWVMVSRLRDIRDSLLKELIDYEEKRDVESEALSLIAKTGLCTAAEAEAILECLLRSPDETE